MTRYRYRFEAATSRSAFFQQLSKFLAKDSHMAKFHFLHALAGLFVMLLQIPCIRAMSLDKLVSTLRAYSTVIAWRADLAIFLTRFIY